MTTRFTLTACADEIEQRFSKISDGQWKPNYNISAGQLVPIILNEEPLRVVLARFGFIPEWAPNEKIGLKFLNAKAEDLMEIPTLKIAMKYRRCLVIADGFYEWQRIRRGKKPFRIILKKNRIFGFAGMYNVWKGIYTFSIITTKPNAVVSNISDRIPVIIPKDKEDAWLYGERGKALRLLQPYPASKMKSYEVSWEVNSVKAEGEDLIRGLE